MFKRSSGVLAHVTSLPSPHGVGTMGQTAYDFVDFLADAHQTYWQVLPLGHTGFGDSPYQCFSAAAGNPYLIDLDLLVEDGLLTAAEVKAGDFEASPDEADFEQLADTRWPLFRKAYSRVDDEMREKIAAFTEENAEWLPDYALFMALKEEKYHHNDFREDVAHHIGQDRHAVFLDKYHVGGEYGTDFSDIAFREISHGHPP